MARGRDKGDGGGKKKDPALEAFESGLRIVEGHPLFGLLIGSCRVLRDKGNYCPASGFAVVVDNAWIHVHPTRRAAPEEWAFVLGHAVLHLAFGHFRPAADPIAWNAACCATVTRFLQGMKFGRAPTELLHSAEIPARSEEKLYEEFSLSGVPEELRGLGVGGPDVSDLWWAQGAAHNHGGYYGGRYAARSGADDWQKLFEEALRRAVSSAVHRAAGVAESERNRRDTPGTRARRWFLDHYPLLGSLAMAFEIIEEPLALQRMDIAIGAVDASAKTIYLNTQRLSDEECRFVMAHELLHVGLRHETRRQGRDPFLWNVACDYVINAWLIEMGVGELPKIGALLDPELKGLSAESIYDRIVTDLRRYRKLATLRGAGLGDMIDGQTPSWWGSRDGQSLDEFYRRCLSQGLAYHESEGRGYLPAGLIEEIRALSQPPIPWDVELARWFDNYFSPVEKRRTYARPSRRQSSTPDIPRPKTVMKEGALDGRTFGVIIDTSGSMERATLARALGAVASYAVSREVPAVRVVFCDAQPYDQGYLAAEDIAGRVRVKGRGGTILQPAVTLLEQAKDFPEKGPLLVITDGQCDRLLIRREHAFLLPAGRHLPFIPKGPVFRMS